MKRELALALIVTAAQVAAAPPAPYHPHMTGSQLVRDLLGDPAANPLNSVRRERAMGYIHGVMDAAAGTRWCPAGKTVPHGLNYAVVDELSVISPEKLTGDASTLVLATLARLYPCTMQNRALSRTYELELYQVNTIVRRDGLTAFALPFSSNRN